MNSSKVFTVNTASKQMSTDASDLVDIDNGHITVRSERTGKLAVFQIKGRVVDNEGECAMWTAEPTFATLKSCPELAGWIVVVFND